MSKTKTPFFGLGSHGSVGNTLTSQKRGSVTLLRSKPAPTDRYTLPQAYQRWLYQDYAYLWTLQSAATQAEYRSAGVRHHLTAFQYWMKYMLTNLPDIVGWWKLDDNLPPTTTDSSRNNNPGTIIGASPIIGPIDRALYFDGINDLVNFGVGPSLILDSQLTLEALINITAYPAAFCTFSFNRRPIDSKGIELYVTAATGKLTLILDNGPAIAILNSTFALTPGLDYHIVATWDTAIVILYIDGVDQLPHAALGGSIRHADQAFGISSNLPWLFNGTVDNHILYNRALHPTEALRHSLRRYP